MQERLPIYAVEHAREFLVGNGVERGIGNIPMRRHGQTGPHRADLVGGVVSNREDENELWGVRPREFLPRI